MSNKITKIIISLTLIPFIILSMTTVAFILILTVLTGDAEEVVRIYRKALTSGKEKK